jgi:hypothetical protein
MIHVMDREADDFTLMAQMDTQNSRFVINSHSLTAARGVSSGLVDAERGAGLRAGTPAEGTSGGMDLIDE